MEHDSAQLRELTAAVRELAAVSTAAEHRARRSERLFRWSAGLLAVTLALVLYNGGSALVGPAHAQTQGQPGSLFERIEHEVEDVAKAGVEKVEHFAADEHAAFNAQMAALRAKLAKVEASAMEPGHAIAVVLHDVKRMLEVMPQMGEDMHRITATMDQMNAKMSGVPVMAAEMQQMNHKIGVMTYGVDSTMGRMGRFMPW